VFGQLKTLAARRGLAGGEGQLASIKVVIKQLRVVGLGQTAQLSQSITI
jgi:hypothetical protein